MDGQLLLTWFAIGLGQAATSSAHRPGAGASCGGGKQLWRRLRLPENGLDSRSKLPLIEPEQLNMRRR